MRSGEVLEPKHHAVLELNQPSMRLVHLDTALFPAKSHPAEDNDTVARVAPLFRDKLPLPLPELLINLLHPSCSPSRPSNGSAWRRLTTWKSGCSSSVEKSRSPPFQRLNQDWTSSTFSCDIAYSDNPAASRASSTVAKSWLLVTFPPSISYISEAPIRPNAS